MAWLSLVVIGLCDKPPGLVGSEKIGRLPGGTRTCNMRLALCQLPSRVHKLTSPCRSYSLCQPTGLEQPFQDPFVWWIVRGLSVAFLQSVGLSALRVLSPLSHPCAQSNMTGLLGVEGWAEVSQCARSGRCGKGPAEIVSGKLRLVESKKRRVQGLQGCRHLRHSSPMKMKMYHS